MAVGLYKPGQGYWVRVMTATMIGVLTLAGGAWLAEQMGALVPKLLPQNVWVIKVGAAEGAVAPGQALQIVGEAAGDQPAQVIADAVASSYDPAQTRLTVRDVQARTAGSADLSKATAIRAGEGGAAFAAKVSERPTNIPTVEPLIIQGTTVGVVIVIGFLIAYWLTALHKRFVDFLIATDMEMKKVNWSTRRDITMSTIVVILASVMIAASLFVVDVVFQRFFTLLGILKESSGS